MRKRDAIVRGAGGAQLTSSRTPCNAQAIWNRQGPRVVGAQSTSSRTTWKCASEMESSEAQSVLHQWIHVLSGSAQMEYSRQRHGQCLINKFTHSLEKHKRERIVRGMVRAQSTSSLTYWKCASETQLSEVRSVPNQRVHVPSEDAQARWNRQRPSQCSINNLNFTYSLKIRKGNGIIRGVVGTRSTSSRTRWKYASKMESSEYSKRIGTKSLHLPV